MLRARPKGPVAGQDLVPDVAEQLRSARAQPKGVGSFQNKPQPPLPASPEALTVDTRQKQASPLEHVGVQAGCTISAKRAETGDLLPNSHSQTRLVQSDAVLCSTCENVTAPPFGAQQRVHQAFLG